MLKFCPVFLLAAALWAGDISGKWTGSIETTGGTQPVAAVMKQNGAEVTGTIGPSEDRQVPIENGKMDGNKLTFEAKPGSSGQVLKLAFTVTGDDRMEGQVEGEGPDGNKISFKLKLARSPEAAAAPAAANSVTGKWSGTAELKYSDGRSETSGVFMELKQAGQEVTGTAGPREDDQLPIEKGRFEGNKLTFQVTPGEGPVFKISLTLVSADKLEGEVLRESAERKLTGKLALTRQR